MSKAGFVLVGGSSRRMGGAKALLEFEGTPLASRIAEHVRSAAGSATLVGDPQFYGALRWPVIADQIAGRGPISGLHAALTYTVADWNLIVACDLPFVTADFLSFLIERAAGTQAVVPVAVNGSFEPLVAVYHRECLAAVDQSLQSRQYSLQKLVAGLRRIEVTPGEWRRFDRGGLLFQNVNDAEELERARKRVRR